MTTCQTIRIEINKLKSIPPLPVQAQSILNCLSDPDISIEKLVAELEKSPSLTARLLGMANSAYFGFSGKVYTLQKAIISVLGLSLVKSLSLAMVLGDRFDAKRCREFSSKRYWYCAMVTALLSQQFCISDKKRFPDPAVGYTAGLFVNLGLLAMVHTFPDAMDDVFKETTGSDRSVSDILMSWYEIDQYKVGSWLVNRWQLPEVYQCVIETQKQPEYEGDNAILSKLIKNCSALAAQLFLEESGWEESVEKFSELGFDKGMTKTIFERHRSKLAGFSQMIDTIDR